VRLDRSGKILQIKLKFIANTFFTRLQNSPYFCIFKYARAVKQKVWNEAENRERDYGRVRLARYASARLLRHSSPISLLILRKKPDCFAVYFFTSFVLMILNNPLILTIGLLFSTYYSRFLLLQVFIRYLSPWFCLHLDFFI